MFNNAIDHSGGNQIEVLIQKTALNTAISIKDDGTGIFRKIQMAFDLTNTHDAIFELFKGKLTTDPRNHSGEGIFFTSRMMDRFYILSSNLNFAHKGGGDDWLLEAEKESVVPQGTLVYMTLDNHAERTAKEVFDRFSSDDGDYSFDKTIIPIALAGYEQDSLISRSQARRVLARVELFRRIVFDFKGIQSIGQAFSDQIFRVYASEHPDMELVAINMTPEVEQMVKRARTAKLNQDSVKPQN